MSEKTMEKPAKIFISHSSRDIAFVKPLVELFEHIGLNETNMFCSSISGYNVPLGKNIYDYLKEQFNNYDLMVIFVLSNHYYSSAPSLTEMGAAWVLQHKYTSVLLPEFDFKDIKGGIDQMQISIKLDAEKAELKARLNELRSMLVREFGLEESVPSQNIWERHRDEFIEKVCSTKDYWKQLHRLRVEERPFDEWIAPLKNLIKANPDSYDAMYILGTIYAEKKDTQNAIPCLVNTVRFAQNKELQEQANKTLQSLGYIM